MKSNLTIEEKEKKGPDLYGHYDSYGTWIQHITPLQSSSESTNSFKIKVITVGEGLISYKNTGIEIGLASKLDSNQKTLPEWKELGCYYNFLNGAICHRLKYPMEIVDRGEQDDIIEWTISCPDKNGEQIEAILKINGEEKGEHLFLKGGKELFPTLHIGSPGAKVESGYHFIEPKTGKGKFERIVHII